MESFPDALAAVAEVADVPRPEVIDAFLSWLGLEIRTAENRYAHLSTDYIAEAVRAVFGMLGIVQ